MRYAPWAMRISFPEWRTDPAVIENSATEVIHDLTPNQERDGPGNYGRGWI